jgi:hypothetical protein
MINVPYLHSIGPFGNYCTSCRQSPCKVDEAMSGKCPLTSSVEFVHGIADGLPTEGCVINGNYQGPATRLLY